MIVRSVTYLVSATALAVGAFAQTLVDPNLTFDTVVSGLTTPISIAFLDADDFLVIEKSTGQVKRVQSGSVTATVLDLPVMSNSERGLLGMALHPDFPATPHVFLYYSRSTGGADNVSWEDNRVERFTWTGTALTDPQLIIAFPPSSLGNGPNHDGGVILFGPDGKLYGVTGDLNRNGYEQNNQSGPVANVGGIFRLNPDGSIPSDNPFVGDGRPEFERLVAYGVRNSFGMSFDSKTGMLWDTENGPTSYDEVNMVPFGLNSGWNKIMGPDERDPQGLGDLYMISGAFYRDPDFSWLSPIGVTSIVFLHSAKFAPGLRDQCIVGDNNFGQLYRFDMNSNRDGFVLSGSLADKVADSATERNLVRWGTGWGVVTDLRIGPDGNLWLTSLSLGRVYRIRAVTAPDTLAGKVTLGSYGGVPTGVPLSIELRTGDTVVETLTTTVGAFGEYYVSPSSAGTFDVIAKAGHWLSVRHDGVSIGGDVVLDLSFPYNGDVDGDDLIGLADLNTVLLDFGGTAADIDGSGQTDLSDLSTILINFGRAGGG